MQVELHPEAQAETRRAAIWYDERQLGLGDRFFTAVTGTLCRDRRDAPRVPDLDCVEAPAEARAQGGRYRISVRAEEDRGGD